MSIFLQSIERFIEVPEVESPMLVLVVGCVGLALNVFCVLVCHGEPTEETWKGSEACKDAVRRWG